jgi:mannose/fructose/N-acetylgalactosamine-specific phosphotransferase system component IIC
MKYLILILAIAAITSIVLGFTLDVHYTQKLIGFGVAGLFFIVIPLFTYHNWKDKNVEDYMLTKENLDKMRDNQREEKH